MWFKGCGGGPAGVDEVVPGPVAWESESSSAAGVDDPAGDGEEPEPEAFGFPSAGGLGRRPGQGLGPGQEVGGERDDLQPDLVLGEAVEGQVAQAGVLEAADAVLGSGSLPVPDLQIGQSPPGAVGVGGEAGDPPARRGRSTAAARRDGAVLGGRSPASRAASRRQVSGSQRGQLGDLGAVAGLPVAVHRGPPRLTRAASIAAAMDRGGP